MSVVAKRGKSGRKPESASETLDQLETMGDRIGAWIAEHALMLLAAAALILATAGGYGLFHSSQQSSRQEASKALANVENAYIRSMGSSPDAILITEPANAETARRVREEYLSRYTKVAEDFEGTLESKLAWLAKGALQQQLGRGDEAIATWQAAIEASSDHAEVQGLLYERVAGAHETEGRWVQAGEAHEAASRIAKFPIRFFALGEAARCYAEAGDKTKALSLFDRLESEAPQHPLSPTILARLSEMRASQ